MGRKHVTPRELMGKRRTPGEIRRVRTLLRLAKDEFGRLAKADRVVVAASALGEIADFSGDTPRYFANHKRAVDDERATDRVNNARDRDAWPDPICEPARNRPIPTVELRPEVVRWLLTNQAALPCVHSFGVRISVAHLPGLLDLEETITSRPLGCYGCVLGGVILRRARCRTIALPGCLLTGAGMPLSDACSLNADGVRIGGSVFLSDGFRGEREVRLLNARIAGDLSCQRGSFVNPLGRALSMEGAKIEGGVYLNGSFWGEVRLHNARIAGDLDCNGGSFVNLGGPALSANRARVEGALFLRKIQETRGVIDLTRAHIGYLNDHPGATRPDGRPAWPERISLASFRYDGIFPGAPLGARDRLVWLENHDRTMEVFLPDDPPDPQPYRQLAEVLKSQGREVDARAILFGYERRRAAWHAKRVLKEYPKLVRFGHGIARVANRFASVLRWLYEWSIGRFVRWLRPLLTIAFPQFYRLLVGFGFYRWRALAWLAVLWLIGSLVFSYQGGSRMQPTQALAMRAFPSTEAQRDYLDPVLSHPAPPANAEEARLVERYPTFNALIYSLDTLVPLVGFQQEAYWTPRSDPEVTTFRDWWTDGGWWSGRWWTKLYLVIHISMGWVIATLFAASFTRLMRHD